MLEFGIRRGLAVRADYGQRMENDRYYYALKKRNEDEAKVKAKMYADDFDYMNAVNEHDNPIIKDFAKKKIQEVGAWVQANPDWESNVSKRMEYKRMIHDLKDNKDLNRGLQTDESKKAWDQWRIKNPDLANSEEGKAIELQWTNYLKYGNQFGPGKEKAAFAFTPPEAVVDYTEYLRKIAGDTEFDAQNTRYQGYQIINKQSVSDKSRNNAVGLALSSPMKKWIEKDYQARGGDEKFGNIANFTRQIMDPFFKGDGYQYGMIPRDPNSGSGKNDGPLQDYWKSDTTKAMQQPNTPVRASAGGVGNLLMDRKGNYNFKGAYIVNSAGNHVPVKDFVTKNSTTAGSSMTYRQVDGNPKSGRLAISTTVKMPKTQFETLFDDKYDSFQFYNPADWLPGSSGVEDEYKSMFKEYTDEDENGNKIDYVEFDVNQDFDPYNDTHAGAYNYGNYGSREKTQSFETGNYVQYDSGEIWEHNQNNEPVRRVK